MDLTIEKGIRVPMRDGVELATDVYRPAPDGRYPTLVERIPYNKEIYSMISGWLDVLRAARSGFAVVVQDTRGRYQSDGVFTPFADEKTDGADTIEWAAEQSWSNGSVGMFGGSYSGATQWLAAAEAPPALRTIAPAVTASDYHNGWTYQGGAFQLGFALHWAMASLGLGELLRAGTAATDRLSQLQDAVDQIDMSYARLPMDDHPQLAGLAPYFRQWLDHPDYDDYWRSLSARSHRAGTTIPVLNIGAWHDLFLAGTLDNYISLRSRTSEPDARRHRLVVGPWAHGTVGGVFPQRSFGVRSGLDASDVTGLQLSWFRDVLTDHDASSSAAPVRIFVMGPNEWRDEADWPLPDTRYVDHFLGCVNDARTAVGDGFLAEAPGSGTSSDSFGYDPADPVPTVGGATFLPGLFVGANSGPRDQHAIEQRPDVLCYTAAPLTQPLEVIGPVRVILYVASSAPDTDFTAKLVDVDARGRAENVCDGILRCRYRNSASEPELMVPGEIYEIEIDLVATAYVFAAGHRLRLDISSSNFPRFDRNPNNGSAPAAAGAHDFVVATNTVFHDRARASRLILPVIERDES